MCDPDFHSSPTIVAESEMADSPTVIDVPDPIALQQRSRLAVTVNAIRFMVDGEELTGKDRWTARGFQYQRLRTAFGIKKRWSSSMPKVYMAEILMGSASKLSSDDWSDRTFGGDWKDLRERAIAYCQEYQQEQSTPRKLNLAGPVQFMTLKLYLSYLFPAKEQLNTLKSVRYQHIPGEVHFSRSAFRDIVYIGQRTNELLAASEQEEAECPRWGDEKKLHQALQRLFTPYSYHWFPVRFIHFVCEIVWRTSSACFHQVLRWWKGPAYTRVLDNSDRKRPDPKRPEANPMNWILPAYDPVWRVVMRCFLEIRYRASGGNENHSEIMRRYLEDLNGPVSDPIKALLWGKTKPESVWPLDIVKEALRLYPPTPRLHRRFGGRYTTADIEQCHRAELLAGADPLLFSPKRWQSICKKERDAVANMEQGVFLHLGPAEEALGFMPFALSCPADKSTTESFGYHIIALLVAILCGELDPKLSLVGET
jgi:hypothetical protein